MDANQDELGRFIVGNKAALTPFKEVLGYFEQMLKNAEEDDEILCFSDACYSVRKRDSTIDYYIKKYSVLENFKKDIQKAIIRRINRGAITGKYKETYSIFRTKLLGEDIPNVTTTVNYNSEITKDEARKIAKDLENEY